MPSIKHHISSSDSSEFLLRLSVYSDFFLYYFKIPSAMWCWLIFFFIAPHLIFILLFWISISIIFSVLSCPITQLQKSVLPAVKWHSSSFFTLFPSPFLECHQLFSISNRDQRLNHLFNVPKSQWSSLWFYKQTKTKQEKQGWPLHQTHFWANILDHNVLFWQNLLLLFLLNILPPQHLWINFRSWNISIWIIHGNVQALHLGWHSSLYPVCSSGKSKNGRMILVI